MLVLSRRKDEVVVLTTASGERVRLIVVKIEQGKVRLAFDADRDAVRIVREEIQRGAA